MTDHAYALPHALVPRWIIAFVMGELIGILPLAVVGAIVGIPTVGDAQMVVSTMIAGLLQGAILGYCQSLVLRTYAPSVNRPMWILATALAMAFAWAVTMAFAAALGPDLQISFSQLVLLLPAWIVALMSLGLAQWVVMRLALPDCRVWILCNTGAWLLGVLLPLLAMSIAPGTWTLWSHALVIVIFGVAMGGLIGALTGLVLESIVQRASDPRSP